MVWAVRAGRILEPQMHTDKRDWLGDGGSGLGLALLLSVCICVHRRFQMLFCRRTRVLFMGFEVGSCFVGIWVPAVLADSFAF